MTTTTATMATAPVETLRALAASNPVVAQFVEDWEEPASRPYITTAANWLELATSDMDADARDAQESWTDAHLREATAALHRFDRAQADRAASVAGIAADVGFQLENGLPPSFWARRVPCDLADELAAHLDATDTAPGFLRILGPQWLRSHVERYLECTHPGGHGGERSPQQRAFSISTTTKEKKS